jgi:hypothetical protein
MKRRDSGDWKSDSFKEDTKKDTGKYSMSAITQKELKKIMETPFRKRHLSIDWSFVWMVLPLIAIIAMFFVTVPHALQSVRQLTTIAPEPIVTHTGIIEDVIFIPRGKTSEAIMFFKDGGNVNLPYPFESYGVYHAYIGKNITISVQGNQIIQFDIHESPSDTIVTTIDVKAFYQK